MFTFGLRFFSSRRTIAFRMATMDARPWSRAEIRDRFRAIGNQGHLTQARLGAIINVCRQSISEIENARVRPHPSTRGSASLNLVTSGPKLNSRRVGPCPYRSGRKRQHALISRVRNAGPSISHCGGGPAPSAVGNCAFPNCARFRKFMAMVNAGCSVFPSTT